MTPCAIRLREIAAGYGKFQTDTDFVRTLCKAFGGGIFQCFSCPAYPVVTQVSRRLCGIQCVDRFSILGVLNMSMPSETRDRLIEALRRQYSQLVVLFQSEHRDSADLHYAAATILRSMLCDKDWPTLLSLAAEVNIDLPVWGPLPESAGSSQAPAMFDSALVASPTRAVGMMGEFVMPLGRYLDAPIGATKLDPENPEAQGRWYTARQLIKWIANKEGPAHFDPKQSATLGRIATGMQALDGCSVTIIRAGGAEIPLSRNDNLSVRIAMLQLMETAIAHSKKVLTACNACPEL